MKNAGKACNNRLYRHIRTFEKIIKNYFVISSTFILDRAEYAKICREINTNYSKYEGKTYAVHISYGIDNKPYWYYFENHGYDNYNIYMRIEM